MSLGALTVLSGIAWAIGNASVMWSMSGVLLDRFVDGFWRPGYDVMAWPVGVLMLGVYFLLGSLSGWIPSTLAMTIPVWMGLLAAVFAILVYVFVVTAFAIVRIGVWEYQRGVAAAS